MLRPGEMLKARWKFMLGFSALIGTLAGCEPAIQRDERPQEDWLARVGSATIALDDVVRYLKFQQIDTPEGDVVDVDNDLFQREALDALIEEALLLEAAKARRLVVSASDISKAWDSIRGGWGESQLDEWLQRRDETPETFKAYLKRSLMTARYLNEQVYARASIRSEDIETAIEAIPQAAAKPRVKASQIVVPSLDEAKLILRELRRGLSFESAAREYSITPEGKLGGHLGWFEPDQMPKLYQQCFNMWPGQLSQVLQSEYGYVILKLHERETAKSRGDTARDPRVVEEALMYKRRRELLIEELKRLKEQYPIERRRMPGADAQ